MNEKGYILPLGSVVVLNRGGIPLMIVGRAQLYNNEGTIGYFDYSALLYPQGVSSDQEYAFFNDEDIEKILFEGFRNDQEKEFAENYDKHIQETSYPRFSIDREGETKNPESSVDYGF